VSVAHLFPDVCGWFCCIVQAKEPIKSKEAKMKVCLAVVGVNCGN
jgi:small subunit ribosomal protein S25e